MLKYILHNSLYESEEEKSNNLKGRKKGRNGENRTNENNLICTERRKIKLFVGIITRDNLN